ncbi:MAG: hypothetical protein F2832_01110 [Actinobacteria bacterium]|nr:hypothetical protein [Actinomycetota bacterium]
MPRAHLVRSDPLNPTLHRIEDRHPLRGALEEVTVAGQEQRRAAGAQLGLREPAEQVVGFERIRRSVKDRPPEGRQQAGSELPLRGELVRHRRPRGVVPGVEGHPIGRGLGAEADRHGARCVVGDRLEHHVRGAEQRVDRGAVRAGDRLRQGEERAVEDRRGVDGEQGRGHRVSVDHGR